MSYKIDMKNEPDYLYVEATGTRSIETIAAIIQDYVEACDKHGYKKVLLDAQRLTGKLSITNIYQMAKEQAKKYKEHSRLKVAVVDLEENRDRFRFFETVLVNIGFEVRFFSEVAAAQQWLGGSEDIFTKSDK